MAEDLDLNEEEYNLTDLAWRISTAICAFELAKLIEEYECPSGGPEVKLEILERIAHIGAIPLCITEANLKRITTQGMNERNQPLYPE